MVQNIVRYEVYYRSNQFVGAIDLPRKADQYYNVWDMCFNDAETRSRSENSYLILGKQKDSDFCRPDFKHDIRLGYILI